jgi:peptide/nickel transport system permease protein
MLQLKLFYSGQYSHGFLKYPYLRESFTKQGKSKHRLMLAKYFVLAVTSIIIALIRLVSLGVISALKDTFIDKSIQILSTIGMSVPSFF